MQIGIDSFVAIEPPEDPARLAEVERERVQDLLAEIELADRVGIDVFGLGEHHREEYVSSAPPILLAAAAARTERILLSSSVTVLSSDDPIRAFQQFATVDLISNGRAEITVGRGSFVESYPLFGLDLSQYDELFAEKLDLLLAVRDHVRIHWSGRTRAPLAGEGVWPRPVQARLPVRLGVGGTPASFVRAGVLGLPLTVAIIGGDPLKFRRYVDLYRQAYREAGHPPEGMDVAVHTHGFLAEDARAAAELHFPSYEAAFSKIGRERGWGPVTRGHYEGEISPNGALLVGDPATVAAKLRRMDEGLGGISRVQVLMDFPMIDRDARMRSIELLASVKAFI